MFIRIESDILESVIKLPPGSRAEQTLMEVSLAVSRGKHYVYIPNWDVYSLQLERILSSTTFYILDGLRRQDGNTLDARISRKLIVTDNVPQDIPEDVMIFSPSINSSLEIFEEVHLICENINEKRFYDKVEAFYRRYIVQEYSQNTRYNVVPRNGGGASCASVFSIEKLMGHHFVLSIADSDYKYCLRNQINGKEVIDKGEKGRTAGDLETMMIEHPYAYGKIYIMEECREVENLIPKKILREIQPNNNQSTIDLINNYDIEYLDVKEGIRIVHLFEEKVLTYWSPYLTSIGYDINKVSDMKRTHGSKAKYKEYLKSSSEEEKRNNIIVEGWGNSILEDSINKKNDYYDNVSPTDLTPSQLHEWQTIGKNLFEWGLASYPLLR